MKNNNERGRRTESVRAVRTPRATSQVYTPEQRETVRRGPRILARIFARAHLPICGGRGRMRPHVKSTGGLRNAPAEYRTALPWSERPGMRYFHTWKPKTHHQR